MDKLSIKQKTFLDHYLESFDLAQIEDALCDGEFLGSKEFKAFGLDQNDVENLYDYCQKRFESEGK